MYDPRNRFLLFILGLTIGAMVSGAVVYLLLNKEKSAIAISKGMIDEIADKVSVLLSREKSEPAKSEGSEHGSMNSSASLDTTHFSQEQNADSEVVKVDSLSKDSLAEEEFLVRKDELLESRMIEVIELSQETNVKTKSDSLLEQASGIKSDKRNTKEKILFTIEFWKSPVNFRGYKLGKNKLVLYGLDNTIPVNLYKFNGSVYLKYDQALFKVESDIDYRAFERITDQVLISVFNHS